MEALQEAMGKGKRVVRLAVTDNDPELLAHLHEALKDHPQYDYAIQYLDPEIALSPSGRLVLNDEEFKYYASDIFIQIDVDTISFGEGVFIISAYELIKDIMRLKLESHCTYMVKCVEDRFKSTEDAERMREFSRFCAEQQRKANLEDVSIANKLSGQFILDCAIVDVYRMRLKLLDELRKKMKEKSFRYDISDRIEAARNHLVALLGWFEQAFKIVYRL